MLEAGLKYNKNISYESWQVEEHNKDLRFDITCPHMHVLRSQARCSQSLVDEWLEIDDCPVRPCVARLSWKIMNFNDIDPKLKLIIC